MRFNRLILTTFGIFLFGLSTLTSCSSKNSKFEDKLFYYLNDSRDPDFIERRNKIFNELYGLEKAKNKGLEYCKLLYNGVSKEEVIEERVYKHINLMSEKKITAEEAADISLVEIAIELAAQETYCPEHKSIEQIPIKERLK